MIKLLQNVDGSRGLSNWAARTKIQKGRAIFDGKHRNAAHVTLTSLKRRRSSQPLPNTISC